MNYPNPDQNETTVPFTLTNPADVKIELFDLNGRKVVVVKKPAILAGKQKIKLNLKELWAAQGSYIYRLEVTSKNGIFRQCKRMTSL